MPAGLTDDPACRSAAGFYMTFAPADGVDYAWVVARAKEQYAAADASFKAMDDKAGSFLTLLGNGAGLLTLGSAAAVAAGQIDYRVAAAGVPAFASAVLSLVFAAVARRPAVAAYPPGADSAAAAADWYGDGKGMGEAFTVGGWHLAAALTFRAADRKAGWVSSATWMFVVAVGLLLAPLVVAVYLKWPK